MLLTTQGYSKTNFPLGTLVYLVEHRIDGSRVSLKAQKEQPSNSKGAIIEGHVRTFTRPCGTKVETNSLGRFELRYVVELYRDPDDSDYGYEPVIYAYEFHWEQL